MTPTLADIAAAVEAAAPLRLQEEWDNSGWQLIAPREGAAAPCTGALTCVDLTPAVLDEAVARGANLVLTHHPLIFRGLKRLTGATRPEQLVAEAMRRGVSVYSAHTSLDSARGGVSFELGRRLGLEGMSVLHPDAANPGCGLGVTGTLPAPMTARAFAELVKRVYGAPVARCSAAVAESGRMVSRVALCGGAGGEFIPEAIAAGADAYVNSDTRHHDFVDHGDTLLIVDIGHHEAEHCACQLLADAVNKKFANFAVATAASGADPIVYI